MVNGEIAAKVVVKPTIHFAVSPDHERNSFPGVLVYDKSIIAFEIVFHHVRNSTFAMVSERESWFFVSSP